MIHFGKLKMGLKISVNENSGVPTRIQTVEDYSLSFIYL